MTPNKRGKQANVSDQDGGLKPTNHSLPPGVSMPPQRVRNTGVEYKPATTEDSNMFSFSA